MTKIPLCTVAGLLQSTSGPIVGIFNQYAHYGEGHTLHSPLQLEDWGSIVNDKPRRLGGQQQVVTHEGHTIPLSITEGLLYMDMRPPTDEELNQYPHVMMTSDQPWDPSSYDNDAPLEDADHSPPDRDAHETWDLAAHVNRCVLATHNTVLVYQPKSQLPSKPNFEKL